MDFQNMSRGFPQKNILGHIKLMNSACYTTGNQNLFTTSIINMTKKLVGINKRQDVIVGGFVGSKSHAWSSHGSRSDDSSLWDFVTDKLVNVVQQRTSIEELFQPYETPQFDTSLISIPNHIEKEFQMPKIAKEQEESVIIERTNSLARTLSECSVDSEDSFIVFDSRTDEPVILEDLYDTDSSSDEDEPDCCLFTDCTIFGTEYIQHKFKEDCELTRIQEANKKWNQFYGNQFISNKEKKVNFSDKTQTHCMFVWPFAHRQARKGHWEMLGRDADRFKKKINDIGKSISYVLAAPHRKKIYEERFMNLD